MGTVGEEVLVPSRRFRYHRAVVKPQEQGSPRKSWSVVVGHATAVVMTMLALLANNITLVSGDYRAVVIAAVGWSGGAIVLSFALWRELTLTLKLVSLVLVLANIWTLYDAAGRRLPAVMGW